LWASLDAAFTDPHGFDRTAKAHGTRLDRAARLRCQAYLHQARQYYGAISGLAPAAKPLLAYYFALNLTKAYLTVVDPPTTVPPLKHGLSQVPQTGARYSFKRERFRVQAQGVFRLLAERTGMGHCWSPGYELALHELTPYLPEAYSLYADAYAKSPSLVPLNDVELLFGEGRTAWLRLVVDRAVLRQRDLSAVGLLAACRVLSDRFVLVSTGSTATHCYELKDPHTYGHRRVEVLPALARAFDECLLASDRSFPGSRRFAVLSLRPQLLSHEAVTFGVLHHLSNLVRYRPNDAERLLGGQHAWLLNSWVDRASEGFLLNLASRITREEHLLA
jgi:hypothetical protein